MILAAKSAIIRYLAEYQHDIWPDTGYLSNKPDSEKWAG